MNHLMILKFISMLAANSGVAPVVPWYAQGGAPDPVQANKFLGASSFAASKVNLITPGTLDLIDGAVAPGWATETGALFGAADPAQSLRTGITSANNNVSAFACFTVSDNAAMPNSVFGSYDSFVFYAQRKNAANTVILSGSAEVVTIPFSLASGTHTLAITGNQAYIDGAPVGAITDAIISLELYLGALNYASGAVQGSGCYITHWAFWRSILSDGQIAAIHAKAIAEATNP